MRYLAKFNVFGDSELIYNCFFPETSRQERFELGVDKTKDGVEITVKAKDSVALKAMTNSVIKLIESFEKLNKVQ